MKRTPENLYQAVRPILQGDRDVSGWAKLLKTLNVPAADTPHFRQEFEPAILASLDRDWQDGVRVVTHEHPARVRRYARIYGVITTWRHSGTYFKKSVKELAADIGVGVEDGHYSGLYMYRVVGLPNLMLEELLASGRVGPITHFHVEEVSQSETYARYKGPENQLAAMIDALLDRDAANLLSFGATQRIGAANSMWDTLLARREELTSLESVTLKVDDLFARLDALAPLELRELTVTGYVTEERYDALFTHPVSEHLLRMKCPWHDGESDFIRWVEKGLAPSVREWCVKPNYQHMHESLYFDTARAMFWRERLEGKEQHLLDVRVVSLPASDAEATRAHLFDGDKLKPSVDLEALSVGTLDADDSIALLEQAREAWPNLKVLYLSNTFDHGTSRWTYLNGCELLEHLDAFEWGSIIEFSDSRICRDLKPAKARVTTYREAVAPYLDEIQERAWRPILAARLAFDLIHNTTTLPTCKALAKLVGMPVDASDGSYSIRQKLKPHMLEMIGPNGLSPSPFINSSPDYDALRRNGPMSSAL